MTKFKTPPLKRHPALQPLSRDHYVGLVQARHLSQAADGSDVDRRAAVAAFLDAWDSEIAEHFNDEERLLGPLADEAGRDRLHEEHRSIRELVTLAREKRRQVDPGAQWVRLLGETLAAHIRWEERELFPAMEAAVTGELDALQPEADRIEVSRSRSRGRAMKTHKRQG